MRWTIFFVKEFCIHSVGITLHRQRSIAKMRQKNGRDPDVVIDHLAFGEPDFWVENLVQVRDGEVLSVNNELGFCGHRQKTSNTERPTSNAELAASGLRTLFCLSVLCVLRGFCVRS